MLLFAPGDTGVCRWFEESSEDGELPAEGVLIGSDIAIGMMGYGGEKMLEWFGGRYNCRVNFFGPRKKEIGGMRDEIVAE
jgi:hypothetical protein